MTDAASLQVSIPGQFPSNVEVTHGLALLIRLCCEHVQRLGKHLVRTVEVKI